MCLANKTFPALWLCTKISSCTNIQRIAQKIIPTTFLSSINLFNRMSELATATWALVIVSGILAISTIVYSLVTIQHGKKLDELNNVLSTMELTLQELTAITSLK